METIHQRYLDAMKANAQVAAMNATLQTDLIDLQAAAIDLLNQLALLTRDDSAYLWRIGGNPLLDAYLALKRAVEITKVR